MVVNSFNFYKLLLLHNIFLQARAELEILKLKKKREKERVMEKSSSESGDIFKTSIFLIKFEIDGLCSIVTMFIF